MDVAVTIPTVIFGVPDNPKDDDEMPEVVEYCDINCVTDPNDEIDTVSIISFADTPKEKIIEVPLVAVYSAEDNREPFKYTSIYPGVYCTLNVVCPSVAIKLLVFLCEAYTPVNLEPSP